MEKVSKTSIHKTSSIHNCCFSGQLEHPVENSEHPGENSIVVVMTTAYLFVKAFNQNHEHINSLLVHILTKC